MNLIKGWSGYAWKDGEYIDDIQEYFDENNKSIGNKMNLISCDNCGVVLDKDKLKFPEVPDDCDTDIWYNKNAVWYGAGYHPIIPCPVCKNDVVDEYITL